MMTEQPCSTMLYVSYKGTNLVTLAYKNFIKTGLFLYIKRYDCNKVVGKIHQSCYRIIRQITFFLD